MSILSAVCWGVVVEVMMRQKDELLSGEGVPEQRKIEQLAQHMSEGRIVVEDIAVCEMSS
jgi:hypothetical protein